MTALAKTQAAAALRQRRISLLRARRKVAQRKAQDAENDFDDAVVRNWLMSREENKTRRAP